MLVRKRYHSIQGAVMNYGVGVENEDVLALRCANADVICFRESQIAAVFNDVNLGKRSANQRSFTSKPRRTLGRAIIASYHRRTFG